MRILLITEKITYGGASKVMIWLAQKLWEHGYRATLCSVYASPFVPVQFKGDYINLDVKFASNILKRNTISLFTKWHRINLLLKKGNYDIVLNFADYTLYLLLIGKIIFRYNLVVSERVDPYHSRSVSDQLRRFLYRYVDFLVYQTDEARNFFKGVCYYNSVVINNPVISFLKSKWNFEISQKIIVNVARYDIYQKRQDILLEAFSIVHKEFPDYVLRLAGDGEGRAKIEAKIKKLKLESRVILGKSLEPASLLCESRLFVLSSDFEGIPNALIEALEIGIPIISTDTSPGGARLLLGKNSEYGIIVPTQDVTALANAIIGMLKDRDKLLSYSCKGDVALKPFEEDSIFQQWVKLFNSLIK